MAAGHEEENENEIENDPENQSFDENGVEKQRTPDWSNQTKACQENLENAITILEGNSNGILEASPLSIPKKTILKVHTYVKIERKKLTKHVY